MSDPRAHVHSELAKLHEDLARYWALRAELEATEREAGEALLELVLHQGRKLHVIDYVRKNLLEVRAFVTGREDLFSHVELELIEQMWKAYFVEDPMAGPKVTLSPEGFIIIDTAGVTDESQPDNQNPQGNQ